MPKSIIQRRDNECFICGKAYPLHTHHVFYGAGLRKISDKYGLTVRLCPDCHLHGPHAVHRDPDTDRFLKRLGQEAYMEVYNASVEDFRKIFRKNYL